MVSKLILLGILTATAYRPVSWQTKPTCTDRHHCETANGENVSQLGVAVSQDFLDSGVLHYGDALWIDGIGYRLVNDCLNRRYKRRIDVFVYQASQEKAFGVRHLKVWLVPQPETKIQEAE